MLDARSRQARFTRLEAVAPRRFDVVQVLCDPEGDDSWALFGEVDLSRERDPEGPLVRLVRIGA